jgi:uncharacterized protein (UPF0332 family)
MSLQNWHRNGWLRPHKTTSRQITELFGIVDRDLKDAHSARLSADWQFGIAYNANLKLCTILLYASGYRPEKSLAHYRTIQALPLVLGDEFRNDADYLDTCRSKRNTAEYDLAGQISDEEAKELIDFGYELRSKVVDWLKSNHQNLAVNVT